MSPGASKKMKSARAREKHLNISDFGLIEEGAMRRARDKAIRISVVLTTIVAWLSISNHCAVGAMVAAKTQSPMAQMHCHGSQPAPSKNSGDEEMPCCKVLRATLAGQGKIARLDTLEVSRIFLFSVRPFVLDCGNPVLNKLGLIGEWF